MLIWSLSSDIYRFKIFLNDNSMDKISFHSKEIEHVSYSVRLEKVISYDTSHKVVIWDINTMKSCQVLLFDGSVHRIFPFQKEPKMIALGSTSYMLEKIGLNEHFGDFILWEAIYDPYMKRFCIITNQDVRILDFIDGKLLKLFVHDRKDLVQDHKFFEAIQNKHGRDYFLAMNNTHQFCLYNFKTVEQIKEIHSPDKHKNETPSAFYYIRELELLAIGYLNSKIQGRVYIFFDDLY